jgi:hypothetical protein
MSHSTSRPFPASGFKSLRPNKRASCYTIDDILEALERADAAHEGIHPGEARFYIQMAYAMGMGLQPRELYAKLAELDRVKAVRGITS